MNIDSMPTNDRVSFGKEKETTVISCLNNRYSSFGYNLIPSSFQEDCNDKIDCWQIQNEQKYPVCIKTRTSKDDILVSMFDPFFGINNTLTKIGRDFSQVYAYYITMSKDEKTIRVANGKRIHSICLDIWNEFVSTDQELVHSMEELNPRELLDSEKYSGCQLWLHYDRFKCTPKILAFIPPTVLGKDCRFHCIY